MAKARNRSYVGDMACWCCKREIPVKQDADTGTLSFPCSYCDFPGYATAGTEAHAIAKQRMKPKAAAEPKPAPTPAPAKPAPAPTPAAPAPAPTPAAAPRRSTIFG